MAICEFVFNVTSPYNYLASTQLKALRERTGCELRLHPVALGGIFKSTGRAELPPPPQLRWMTHDLARWAKKYGVPFRFPSAFPTRTLLAQRTIVAAAADHGRAHGLVPAGSESAQEAPQRRHRAAVAGARPLHRRADRHGRRRGAGRAGRRALRGRGGQESAPRDRRRRLDRAGGRGA